MRTVFGISLDQLNEQTDVQRTLCWLCCPMQRARSARSVCDLLGEIVLRREHIVEDRCIELGTLAPLASSCIPFFCVSGAFLPPRGGRFAEDRRKSNLPRSWAAKPPASNCLPGAVGRPAAPVIHGAPCVERRSSELRRGLGGLLSGIDGVYFPGTTSKSFLGAAAMV